MNPVLVVGKQAGTHMRKPIHLPETFALPFKYMLNTAIGFPRPDIG
jgi:hypothetical protein